MEKRETAVFAGGCFWCITPTFALLDGVDSVVSGYSGGTEENPTYEAVKSQKTGHREAISIDFDPEKVRYEALLSLFLDSVDPFDPGGQYIDRGHSYTLAIYYRSPAQQRTGAQALAALEQAAGRTPCVALEPYRNFYPAEEYHQDYYRKHPEEFRRELIESGRIQP